ncbi:MAG: ammonium transporter [Methylohalobius sp.]|nr:ammonium transporter [Methylohalobius sp.]
MDQAFVELRYALDTLYLLVSGLLVLAMGVGLALFQAGLVRPQSAVSVLIQNLTGYAVVYLVYLLFGYRLMYPAVPLHSIWPGVEFLLGQDWTLREVLQSEGGLYSSKMADFFFQVGFVVIALGIVSGAMAERVRLFPFLLFAAVLAGFIYPLLGFWKWGGGFLDEIGFFDFAGAGLVHVCGAAAALAGVILLGPRAGRYGLNPEPDPLLGGNAQLAAVGAFILGLGWVGFNGGAELRISTLTEANAVARIFVNTYTAAASGAMAALLMSRAWFGQADLIGAVSGALAGMVAIAAEPLTPVPWQSMAVGAIGGAVAVCSLVGLDKLRLDDPVGALSIHGAAGIWGLLAVCLSNPQAKLSAQLVGIGVILGFAFAASFVFWGALKMWVGIRK